MSPKVTKPSLNTQPLPSRELIPTLGTPRLRGASDFIRRYFPREYVIANLFRPEKHVIPTFIPSEDRTVYYLNEVFVKQSYEALLRTGRSAICLVSDLCPFVEIGKTISFPNELGKLASARAKEIGGFPINYPSLNDEDSNPLAQTFDSEIHLLRAAHLVQRSIKQFLSFIERAYNFHGYSTDSQNPWDFHEVLSPASDDGINACFVRCANYLPYEREDLLRPTIDHPFRDEDDDDSMKSDPLPSTNEVPIIERPQAPSPDVDRPAPITAHANVQVPEPVPIVSIPGFDLVRDLDTIAINGNSGHSDSPRLISIAETPNTTVDPRLLSNRVSALLAPPVTVNAFSARVNPDVEDENEHPYHPNCRCKNFHVFENAYQLGRKDEHDDILRQNLNHGFIAHKIQDFFDFAAYTADNIRIRPFSNAEQSPPRSRQGSPTRSLSPPHGSPIVSDDSF
jgi:hypothetical protein